MHLLHRIHTLFIFSCFDAQPHTNGQDSPAFIVSEILAMVVSGITKSNHDLDSLKYCDDTMIPVLMNWHKWQHIQGGIPSWKIVTQLVFSKILF